MTDLLAVERSAPDDGAGRTEDPGLDQELSCVEVVSATHDVRTFVLRTPPAWTGRFQAGQHLVVSLVIDDAARERCYTIASSPTRTDRISLTVKRVPGGPVSNWLHDHLGVGDRLHVRGPFGRFTMDEHPATKHLFLSAGSGITPLMSMTRSMQDLPGPRDVAFVHSARTPKDIIFRGELESMAQSGGWLTVTTVCEEDGTDETWSGHRGRLTRTVLEAAVPDLRDREVFTCGPEPYMRAVRTLLEEAGVDPARCHEESFLLGAPARTPADSLATSDESTATGFAVEFRRSGRTVRCERGSTLLDAALRAGVNLPFSCGAGMCGTCKSTLLHGTVDMRHSGGIRQREIDDHKILICCSRPLDDLAIDA